MSRPAITVPDALRTLGACSEAQAWAAAYRPQATRARDYWTACERGDWLLWIAARAGVERRVVVLAACACARLALPHVPAGEERPHRCIEVTEAWCRGEATIEQVREARAYADAADVYAADAYAAAAADAAYADAAYAYAAAADAAYAAYAAYADAAYAYAAYVYAYAADDARAATLRQCADEVRRIIPWEQVDRALYLAAGGVL